MGHAGWGIARGIAKGIARGMARGMARGIASIETGRIGLLNDWGRTSLAMYGLVVEVAGAFDFRRQLAPGWRSTPCRNFDVQQLNSIFFSSPLVFGWFHSELMQEG